MASRERKTLSLEAKTFEVKREDEGFWELHEKELGGSVTSARVSTSLARWISSIMSDAGRNTSSFLGRKSENDLSVIITRRRNLRGEFALLLFVSAQFKRGPKAFIIPNGVDGKGWVLFGGFLREAVESGEGSRMVAQQVNHGIHRVVVRNAFEERVKLLYKRGVIATVVEGECRGKDLGKEIAAWLRISAPPKVTNVNFASFLVEAVNDDDIDILVRFPRMVLPFATLWVERWRPSAQTINLSWLQKRSRWVNFHGVPTHLWNTEVLTQLTRGFGIMRQFERGRGGFRGISVVRVLVDECRLNLMPQVTSCDDEGTIYPVRLIPDFDEVFQRGRFEPDGGILDVPPTREDGDNIVLLHGECSRRAEEGGGSPSSRVVNVGGACCSDSRVAGVCAGRDAEVGAVERSPLECGDIIGRFCVEENPEEVRTQQALEDRF